MSIFGQRLIEARKRQHMTQQELAEKALVSRSGISGYETEGKDASYDVLIRLAQSLGVTADYLIGLDDFSGWEKRRHVAEAFSDLELLYERAGSREKAAMDALLKEADKVLGALFENADASTLTAAADALNGLRRIMKDGGYGE